MTSAEQALRAAIEAVTDQVIVIVPGRESGADGLMFTAGLDDVEIPFAIAAALGSFNRLHNGDQRGPETAHVDFGD